MSDQRIQYTEKMVGAGHPTLTDTLNRLSLIEHNTDGTHKFGVVFLERYLPSNYVTDGSVDYSTQIQSCIDASNGKVIVCPPITIGIATGLINNGKKISFFGTGQELTIFKKMANIDFLTISGSSCNWQNFGGFSINHNNKTGRGIVFSSVNYAKLFDTYIYGRTGSYTVQGNEDIKLNSATCQSLYNITASSLYALNTNCLYLSKTDWAYSGSGDKDIQIEGGTQTTIEHITLSDDIQLYLKTLSTCKISSIYIENSLSKPAILTASSTRGLTIEDIHARKTGTAASSACFISLTGHGHNDDNVCIRNYNFVGGTGTHDSGHIKVTGTLYNSTFENIGARSTTASGLTAKHLIYADTGLLYCKLQNVSIENPLSTDSPGIYSGYFKQCSIENSNVNITSNTSATESTQLINCTGTISDADNRMLKIDSGIRHAQTDVASAENMSLPLGDSFNITGTNNISTITVTSSAAFWGKTVHLKFAGGLTVNDAPSGNLKLAGDFITSTNSTLVLHSFDGVSWWEEGRSSN